MPKRLGEQFTPKARERRYDFERMGVTLDGQVYLLEKGTDYQCAEPAIRGHMREYAKERGLVFASQVRRDGRKVVGVEVAFAARPEELPDMAGSAANLGGVTGQPDANRDSAQSADGGLRVAGAEAA